MPLPRLIIATSITAVIALSGALSAAEGGWSRAQQVWRDGGATVHQELTSTAPTAIGIGIGAGTARTRAPWSRANAVWRDGLAPLPLPTRRTAAPTAPSAGTWSRANPAAHAHRDDQAHVAAGATTRSETQQ